MNAMAVDYNRLWKRARTATDETESVRILAKILSSKDGRAFILDLEQQDAELCIEILDHVNSNPPSTWVMVTYQRTDLGFGGAQGPRNRQTHVLWNTEEALGEARTIARLDGHHR